MKKIIFGALIALLPLVSIADTILGIKVGTGTWDHEPSGSVSVSGAGGVGTDADLQDDLRMSSDDEAYFYFSLEHPVPLVPNIKVMKTGLTSNGAGNVATAFDYNGTTYSAATPVTTALQLDQTDYILYYEVLDNVVSVDVGINAKYVDGKATVNGDAVSFSGYIPMAYVAAELVLPSDFTIALETNMLKIDDSEISDIIAKVTYTTDFMLGVEAGIRSQTIKLSGFDGVNSNIEFDGVFAGVFFKF